MTPWTKLSKEERLTILTNIAEEKGIVENAKDAGLEINETNGVHTYTLPRIVTTVHSQLLDAER